MRQKVVTNKEAHENPVVDTPLKVEGKWQAGHGQLSGEVLNTGKEGNELSFRFWFLFKLHDKQLLIYLMK